MSSQFLEPRQVDVIRPIDPSASELLCLNPTAAPPASECAGFDAELVGEFLGSPERPGNFGTSADHALASQYEQERIDAGRRELVLASRSETFVIESLEEWPSLRRSEPGPRSAEENRARHEIPMFVGIRAVKRADAPTAGRTTVQG